MSKILIPFSDNAFVKIGTYTFTSTSSVSLPNNTFTSAYDQYLLQINAMQITSAANPSWKFRANGTDDSAGNYYYGHYGWSSGNGAINRAGSAASTVYMTASGTTVKADNVYNSYEIKLFTPSNPNGRKNYSYQANYWNNSNVQNTIVGGGFNSTAGAADSFSFLTDGGTMTGYISVYGYKA